jgi:hypothetical protein
MNASAIHAEKLARLDAETRNAWETYRERIQALEGDEYDSVEDESWVELQERLRRVERRRRVLITREREH